MKPAWLEAPGLTTNPEQLAVVDQKIFLDGLKAWSEKHLARPLTNDRIAELLIDYPISVVEAWRTNPASKYHRTMPLRYRLLLVYQLRDLIVRDSNANHFWTPEADQFMRDHYNDLLVRDIAKSLLRTEDAVRARAGDLGIRAKIAKRYSDADVEFIRAHYAAEGAAWVAKHLGRSPASVSVQAAKNGIRGKPGRRRKYPGNLPK